MQLIHTHAHAQNIAFDNKNVN